MIHKAFNQTELAELYYKKLGKFKNREQARKNFRVLVKYDKDILTEIFDQIMSEQKELLK